MNKTKTLVGVQWALSICTPNTITCYFIVIISFFARMMMQYAQLSHSHDNEREFESVSINYKTSGVRSIFIQLKRLCGWRLRVFALQNFRFDGRNSMFSSFINKGINSIEEFISVEFNSVHLDAMLCQCGCKCSQSHTHYYGCSTHRNQKGKYVTASATIHCIIQQTMQATIQWYTIHRFTPCYATPIINAILESKFIKLLNFLHTQTWTQAKTHILFTPFRRAFRQSSSDSQSDRSYYAQKKNNNKIKCNEKWVKIQNGIYGIFR